MNSQVLFWSLFSVGCFVQSAAYNVTYGLFGQVLFWVLGVLAAFAASGAWGMAPAGSTDAPPVTGHTGGGDGVTEFVPPQGGSALAAAPIFCAHPHEHALADSTRDWPAICGTCGLPRPNREQPKWPPPGHPLRN